MTQIEKTCAAILPIDARSAQAAERKLDAKTKPRGSLGQLEMLGVRLAGIYRDATPALPRKAVVVMAGDHGVTEENISAYPAEVTAQMVRNFVRGGAAINVLARQAGAEVVVVDTGTKTPVDAAGVRVQRLGAGTANFTRGPAMSHEVAERAIHNGIALAEDLVREGFRLIALGDMGIGNTTASGAITAALIGVAPAIVTGRGTGIDAGQQARKTRVIERALAVNRPNGGDPIDVLAKVGGFEIGGLAGLTLGCAARRVPVVIDGFITAAAALLATRLCPAVGDYLIAGHRSVEPGHSVILQALDLTPLLQLDMRLGEGSGAALALHLIDAALLILRDMATFDAAGVADSGA